MASCSSQTQTSLSWSAKHQAEFFPSVFFFTENLRVQLHPAEADQQEVPSFKIPTFALQAGFVPMNIFSLLPPASHVLQHFWLS